MLRSSSATPERAKQHSEGPPFSWITKLSVGLRCACPTLRKTIPWAFAALAPYENPPETGHSFISRSLSRSFLEPIGGLSTKRNEQRLRPLGTIGDRSATATAHGQGGRRENVFTRHILSCGR